MVTADRKGVPLVRKALPPEEETDNPLPTLANPRRGKGEKANKKKMAAVGEIVGQRSPDTAIAVAVEDGINHGPHLGFAWPPTGPSRRQEGLQDSPLMACQVTGVWLRVHTLSTFEAPFWNRL